MYINKFSIVEFSPHATTTAESAGGNNTSSSNGSVSHVQQPKKRGRPRKNEPNTNRLMFIKSTETFPMRYELTCMMKDQFKKDKRRKGDCTSTSSNNSSTSPTSTSSSSSSSSPLSNTIIYPNSSKQQHLDACIPITTTSISTNSPLTKKSSTFNPIPIISESRSTTCNNASTTKVQRIVRTSISIRELLN